MKKGAKRQERLDARRADFDKMMKEKKVTTGYKRPGSMAK